MIEIAKEVANRREALAVDNQQCIQVVTDSELVAIGDRRLLRQALLNVLHNAIRHSPPQEPITVGRAWANSVKSLTISATAASELQSYFFSGGYDDRPIET